MNKRTFLRQASMLGLGSMTAISSWGKAAPAAWPAEGSSDHEFWQGIRKGYSLAPDYVNLENGYYCIMPTEIQDKYEQHIREVNRKGAHYMRTVQFENKHAAAAKVAKLAGCSADELILTRNTTESLDLVIGGRKWKTGDEAVMAYQDYGAMLDMFKQMAARYGIVNKMVSVPANPKSDEEIVAVYEKAITSKTKLLMVCHMINITGQILPVKKICEMAHRKGVEVMVDGAHALAHLQFRIDELGCDYYGSSLHKWLSVPIGAGMLYVRRDRISALWPIFAEDGMKQDDILRLNHTGTHPPATDLTISDAVDYYYKLGPERKEARLRYLQQYWTTKVRGLSHLVVNTPEQPERSCAIANVGVKGMKPAELADILMKRYNIYTVAIDNEKAGVQGCRITPNIFTTTDELDRLIIALKETRM